MCLGKKALAFWECSEIRGTGINTFYCLVMLAIFILEPVKVTSYFKSHVRYLSHLKHSDEMFQSSEMFKSSEIF